MKRILASIVLSVAGLAVFAGVSAAAPGDSADLGVTVSADATSVKVGDLVTYTVTVTNHGESVADSAVVSDLLPAGLELVSVDGTPSDGYSWLSSAVATGSLVPDPNDTTSGAAAAARIAEGAALDLGYQVDLGAGKTAITVPLSGPIANIADGSTADATRTVTIVARATQSGTLTNVVSVDSTTNPDPNEAGNNFALVSVTAA
jgi:uncharacterized repeat protein (TIGR01451 family)